MTYRTYTSSGLVATPHTSQLAKINSPPLPTTTTANHHVHMHPARDASTTVVVQVVYRSSSIQRPQPASTNQGGNEARALGCLFLLCFVSGGSRDFFGSIFLLLRLGLFGCCRGRSRRNRRPYESGPDPGHLCRRYPCGHVSVVLLSELDGDVCMIPQLRPQQQQ